MERALVAARTMRLRLACCTATRATTPNFCVVETLLTASILTAWGAIKGATMSQSASGENLAWPLAFKRGLSSKVLMTTTSPDFSQLKAGMKSAWMAGDFGRIANFITDTAEDFVRRTPIQPGCRLLDVACGTGNSAVPAARAGASVTGVDIASNLLAQARQRATAENLDIRFEEGDAEELPFPDRSFDVVLSMFGAMFAPRPERVAAELLRVCKPGGMVAMANWTPEGFVGKSFQITHKLLPGPPWSSGPRALGRREDSAAALYGGHFQPEPDSPHGSVSLSV